MSSTSIEHGRENEEQPLLRHRRKPRFRSLNLQHWYSSSLNTEQWTIHNTREKVKHFLSSKAGHYSVLALVSLDVFGMIADFVLRLFRCELGKAGPDWELALDILSSLGLGFSCLFMVELIASIWAFGYRYFTSWFHCFDAFIVVAGFITDVVLHGVIEEVASFIVVLRLWRVVKIIEELGVGSQERAEESQRRIDELENDIDLLRKEVASLRGLLDQKGVPHGQNVPPPGSE